MKVYLTSFYPLCSTKKGKLAIKTYSELDPYIDGSCRREPDFENPFPCITGLCRPRFAEKLEEHDIVIYVTNKKGVGSRKVVAVFKVIKKINDHKSAQDWYNERKITIPNDLMLDRTSPFPLDKTHQIMGWNSWIDGPHNLENWENGYIKRADESKQVAVCSKEIFINLKEPIALSDKDWKKISNRALCTQNPPVLTKEEISIFKQKTKIAF